MPAPPPKRNKSFIIAKSREEAVARMIHTDPQLSVLYQSGKNSDGKGGWVNAIREQSANFYRLLFYLYRMPIRIEGECTELYELLFKTVSENDEPNFLRANFTMTGAVNLMRNGLPEDNFVEALTNEALVVCPLEAGRDVLVERLRDQGALYIGIYDREHEGLRILDLKLYSEIYDIPKDNEVQVRNEDEVVLGDTQYMRPFLLSVNTTRLPYDPLDGLDNKKSKKDKNIHWTG